MTLRYSCILQGILCKNGHSNCILSDLAYEYSVDSEMLTWKMITCAIMSWLETAVEFYSRVQKSIENFVFGPKMAIFWRAGMKEGGLPLPLAFQYLILMI